MDFFPEALGTEESPLRVFTEADATDKSLLSSGGFGTVYSGRLPGLGSKTVVLKVAQAGVSYSIVAELTCMMQLPPKARALTPTVLGLIEGVDGMPVNCWVQTSDGNVIRRCVDVVGFVMEEMSGDMWDLLGRLNYRGRCHAIKQMAECLAAIHDHNVIHCDIKLANFLVRAHKASGKGIKFTTKVADFGTSRVAAPVGPTWCPLNTGTLGSMAPEMVKPVYADCADPDDGTYASYAPPQAKVSFKSDVYSFGAILMSAHTPEFGLTLEQLMAALSALPDGDAWVKLVNRCMRRNPDNRPTMHEVLDIIRDLHARSKHVKVPCRGPVGVPQPTRCSPVGPAPPAPANQSLAAQLLVSHPLACISRCNSYCSQSSEEQACPSQPAGASACSQKRLEYLEQQGSGCCVDMIPNDSCPSRRCSFTTDNTSVVGAAESCSAASLCTSSSACSSHRDPCVSAPAPRGVRRALGRAVRAIRRVVRMGA